LRPIQLANVGFLPPCVVSMGLLNNMFSETLSSYPSAAASLAPQMGRIYYRAFELGLRIFTINIREFQKSHG